jgi:hypothetical protein
VNIHVDLISRITQSYWQAKFTIANSKPSISVNKVDKSLSPTVTPPLEFPPGPVLLGAIASASSKNIMLGEARRAF